MALFSWRNMKGGDGDIGGAYNSDFNKAPMKRSRDRVDAAEKRHGKPITPKGRG